MRSTARRGRNHAAIFEKGIEPHSLVIDRVDDAMKDLATLRANPGKVVDRFVRHVPIP
jgi:hypothetical protein